jgi:cell division protein FtsA
LHLMPVSFGRDGVESAAVPMGLHGASLTTEMGVVTVDPAALRNLSLTVERCHLSISGYAVSPYAAARGALAADERSLGTIVIDMGGGTTSVAIFKQGKLASAFVIPVGGMQVTSDVAQGLSTTLAHAERMKTMFGAVWPTGYEDREMLAVPLVGERGVDTVQKVPKSTLSAIIKPRIEEIFDMAIQRLNDNPQLAASAGRIVLTGGASQLPGLRDLAAATTATRRHAGDVAQQWLCRCIRASQFGGQSGQALCHATSRTGSNRSLTTDLCPEGRALVGGSALDTTPPLSGRPIRLPVSICDPRRIGTA